MKIQIPQREILKVAIISSSISDERLTNNVGTFCIRAKNNKIELIAINHHTLLHQSLDAIVFSEGEIIVESSIFLNIIKNLKDKVLDIYDQDDMIYIEADAKFRLNKLSKMNNFDFFADLFKISSLSHKFSCDFLMQDHKSDHSVQDIYHESSASVTDRLISLTKSDIVNLFKFTKFAVSNQESRITLNNLALSINHHKITAYGMDGHRLSMYEIEKATNITSNILLSLKLVDLILSILNSFNIAEIQLDIHENKTIYLGFRLNEVTDNAIILISTLSDGDFVNYQKIIPQTNDYKTIFEVDSSKLAESILSVTAISSEKFKALKMIIFNNNTIQTIAAGNNGALGTKLLSCNLISCDLKADEGGGGYTKPVETEKVSTFHPFTDFNKDLNAVNIANNDTIDGSSINNALQKLITIGVNYRYLLDILDVMKGNCAIFMIKTHISPIVVKIKSNSSALFLVMPIKI